MMVDTVAQGRSTDDEQAPSLDELGVLESTTEQGALYVLPQRDSQRGAGIFLIGFGLVFGGMPGTMLVKGLVDVLGGTGSVFELAFAFFTLPFVLIGLALVMLGQAMFSSHTELEVTADELRVRERLGLLRWRSRRPLAAWKRVAMATGAQGLRRAGGPAASMVERSLRVEFEGLRPLVVAPGYPLELTQALARELARLGERAGATAELVLPPPEPVTDRQRETEEDAQLALAPDTDLEVERRGEAILVHVPPRGVWKGSRGVFAMGIFFVLFVAVFAGASVVYPSIQDGFGAEQVPFLLGSLLFGSIGVALLFGGWNMGRRKATLAATREKLVIERISPFGTKRFEWTPDELNDVRIGPSGMSVNDVPIQELQVKARGKKTLGMLSQRDDTEIRWIASELRRALDL